MNSLDLSNLEKDLLFSDLEDDDEEEESRLCSNNRGSDSLSNENSLPKSQMPSRRKGTMNFV